MNRRTFLSRYAIPALTLSLPYAVTNNVQSQELQSTPLRGSIDASREGIKRTSFQDQSRLFQKILNKASAEQKSVFLPAGTYVFSGIECPPHTHIIGIEGATRVMYGGGGFFFSALATQLASFKHIIFDGANHPLNDPLGGLITMRACPDIHIQHCEFENSAGAHLSLNGCKGRITNNALIKAKGVAALYALNSKGLAVHHNRVEECSNGGILIHRSTIGDDGTIVTNNRIKRISALGGGTGQRGNGINLYRANNAIITNNHISDCAFSAIRANSASNTQISNNTCLRSGETAIYAEFAFQGSIITSNIIDGATIGISIANFNEGGRMAICANNLIRNLTLKGPYKAEVAGFGIGIFAEADTNVTGNIIENAPQYGIGMGWGPYLRNVITAQNIIRHARIGIAVSVVKGAQTAIITNNIFDHAEKGAIIGHEWNKAVTHDLAFKGASSYPHLSINNNKVH